MSFLQNELVANQMLLFGKDCNSMLPKLTPFKGNVGESKNPVKGAIGRYIPASSTFRRVYQKGCSAGIIGRCYPRSRLLVHVAACHEVCLCLSCAFASGLPCFTCEHESQKLRRHDFASNVMMKMKMMKMMTMMMMMMRRRRRRRRRRRWRTTTMTRTVTMRTSPRTAT